MSETLPFGASIWHRAYCRWYDNRATGHTVRAAVWGWVADRIVHFA